MPFDSADPLPEKPVPVRTGLSRLWYALGYSLAGLRAAYRGEAAFRQEVLLAALLLPIAAFVPVAVGERALLVGSVLLVLIVELLNTGIEAVVDRVSAELHPLAKRAKDIGSAAVLVSLINLTCIWGIILVR